jgi:polyhydroxybutyrate depolymerase
MRILAFILILICSAASAETFQNRSYEVFDGRRSADPAPLILSLHGAGGNGPRHRRYTSFDGIAADYDVVVAYPTAPSARWNDGRWDALGQPEKAARDDVGWLTSLVAELVTQGVADPDQIYAIGHSNGGAMVRRLTCDAPDLLKGASIVGTTILIDFDCVGTTAIPTAYFMGTDDRIIPFDGRPTGYEGIIQQNIGRAFSAPASASLIAERNGCDVARPTLLNDDPNDDVAVIRHDYQLCRADTVFYEMQGGGHVWPGGPDLPPGPMRDALGGAIRDIDAGVETMRLWFGEAL